MNWLIVALSSYFLIAVVHIVDKYLLKERIPSPGIYAFYMGALGILAFLLAPFGFLSLPSLSIFLLAVFAGAVHILAIFYLFLGLRRFEASRMVPAVGGFLPIFTFTFTLFFIEAQRTLAFHEIIAFFLLLAGTLLITYQGKGIFSWASIKIAALSAFLFAVFFIMMKFVYLAHPFLSGLIWSRLGAFLVVLLFFLFSKEIRDDISKKPKLVQNKTWLLLIPNQIVATLAVVLQNWAIALAPFVYLGIINALEGIKYFFLIFFAAILSVKFPKILKEEVSRKVIVQKILAVALLAAGLLFLSI